ncbi:positive control sigma-like factor [Staphylococcus schweitzeri]|uniref:Positive control sigma-like factor n=1 Tax=Staphylococcus schweitzeri TaxID=1654388 RepID=A0A077UH01_9STAP|nr:positive control sigma-like factor [Staphylococcus schweitzeri]
MNKPISYSLRKLSKIELECFLMVKCEGLSFTQTANLLQVKKGTIQKYLERANTKIKTELPNNLFINLN